MGTRNFSRRLHSACSSQAINVSCCPPVPRTPANTGVTASLLLAIWLSAPAPLAGKVHELLPPPPPLLHPSSLGTQGRLTLDPVFSGTFLLGRDRAGYRHSQPLWSLLEKRKGWVAGEAQFQAGVWGQLLGGAKLREYIHHPLKQEGTSRTVCAKYPEANESIACSCIHLSQPLGSSCGTGTL